MTVPADGTSAAPRFPASPEVKMGEAVADLIANEIAAQGWPVGERLGSEPELIERFGVSRAVFREAVRLLEREEIAAMKRGPSGGLFVTAPGTSATVRTMFRYLDQAGVSRQDLADIQHSLELTCVELVAARLDEDGIQRLRSFLDQEPTNEIYIQRLGSIENFHTLLAELSGNAALALFVQCATQLALLLTYREDHDFPMLMAPGEVHDAHAAIADALIAGDVALARHRMSRHLEAHPAGTLHPVTPSGETPS